MNPKSIVFVLLFSFYSLPSSADQNRFIDPPQDLSTWSNRFYILLDDQGGAPKSQEVINQIANRDFQNIVIGALRDYPPDRVSTLLLFDGRKSSRVGSPNEDARSKLGRYLIVDFPDRTDKRALFNRLTADPSIEYFGVMTTRLPVTEPQSAQISAMSMSLVEEDKAWGQKLVNASQAALYQQGHTLVGIVDNGLDPTHAELDDYVGNNWMGGNYHPHASFHLGFQVGENGNGAHPYTGLVSFGTADEYRVVSTPGDPATACDVNGNGTVESRYVGHGTWVTGLISANATDGTGFSGICTTCPLAVMQSNSPVSCSPGFHPDGSNYEARVYGFIKQLMAGTGMLLDIGAQVINLSSADEDEAWINGFCQSHQNHPSCLVITYAMDRDAILVASAGNGRMQRLGFPASDPRVWGVSGLQNVAGDEFWEGSGGFGSNSGPASATYGPLFSAPAKDVYSTMYEGKSYNPAFDCDDSTDGLSDGYGYCTGTSMSAPFITSIVGLVRSVNPLASANDVKSKMLGTSGVQSYDPEFGYGTPIADLSLRAALGVSNFTQVRNRIIPLFSMYSNVAKDIAQTTKPQVAMAYHINSLWDYVPYTLETVVSGYDFPESPLNPTPPSPRADLFILSTHKSPPNTRSTKPLYRMSWVGPYGGNPNDADWAIVDSSQISGGASFKAAGYDLDGIEGYIYTPCASEPSCMPEGTVKVYRAYNPAWDDHAVFPESRILQMQSQGFTDNLVKLGYAYPNVDSDADGVIDGMEFILGTDPNIADSDCDGATDGEEFPFTAFPVSDPMDSTCGSPGTPQTPWATNIGPQNIGNLSSNSAWGYHFTPQVDGQVSKLGGYFSGTRTVKLFNKTTGALLATASVTSANNFAYTSVTPIGVIGGQTYTVAMYNAGLPGGHWQYIGSNYFPKTWADIKINGSTYISTSSNPNARPTNTTTSTMYGMADIEFIPD